MASLDDTFTVGTLTGSPNSPFPMVSTIAIQPDGKIVIGGRFHGVSGNIARLHGDEGVGIEGVAS